MMELCFVFCEVADSQVINRRCDYNYDSIARRARKVSYAWPVALVRMEDAALLVEDVAIPRSYEAVCCIGTLD